jgi:hypothetical protein
MQFTKFLVQIELATLLLTEAPFPTICRPFDMMDMRRNSHHSVEKSGAPDRRSIAGRTNGQGRNAGEGRTFAGTKEQSGQRSALVDMGSACVLARFDILLA